MSILVLIPIMIYIAIDAFIIELLGVNPYGDEKEKKIIQMLSQQMD